MDTNAITFEGMSAVLCEMQLAHRLAPLPSYQERREDLAQLARLLQENRTALCAAIAQDFGTRCSEETLLCEILPLLKEIAHTQACLKKWIKPQHRTVDWLLYFGAKNRVYPQPLGVVGVIVPWNFPLLLSLGPLVSILAAGNRAFIKMSEHSPHITAVLQDCAARYFATNKVQFMAGGGTVNVSETATDLPSAPLSVGEAFARLPFNHLLFTGSTATGRRVMRTAAAQLCPVTLELGGKSPAVILPDADLMQAVERVLYSKYLNAGQACAAVDYVFVPADKVDAFVAHAKRVVQQRIGRLDNPSFSSIIHQAAYERLRGLLDEVVQNPDTQVISLLEDHSWDDTRRKIAPHLVVNPPPQTQVMQQEIFGPILPIVSYQHVSEVVHFIASRPAPLSFYPFGQSRQELAYVLQHIRSGGVSVNEVLLHVVQADLPFGGIGDSGMGQYHGYEGFLRFSQMRPVFYQSRWRGVNLMMPPYGKTFMRLMRFLVGHQRGQ